MESTSGGYDVLLVAHVLAAVVGFGAVAVTAVHAGVAAARPGPSGEAAVRRYFRAGTNWPARAVYAVPVLGAVLIAMGNGSWSLAEPWLSAGLALWVLGAGLCQAVVWPAERRVQAIVTELGAVAPDGRGLASANEELLAERDGLCRRLVLAASLVEAAFVVALALMVAKPGG